MPTKRKVYRDVSALHSNPLDYWSTTDRFPGYGGYAVLDIKNKKEEHLKHIPKYCNIKATPI